MHGYENEQQVGSEPERESAKGRHVQLDQPAKPDRLRAWMPAASPQGWVYGVSGVWLVQLRRPESSVPSDSTLLLQAEIPHPLVF
jgi:hypothetical protein